MAMTTLGPADIFSTTGAEMREMIAGHLVSVRAAIEKVNARLAKEEEEALNGPTRGLAAFSQVRDLFRSTVKALEKRVEECEFTSRHLQDGDYRMSAAHLLGFRAAYGPIEVDTDRMIYGADEAPVPERQAERNGREALVQVPRMVLPGGLIRQ